MRWLALYLGGLVVSMCLLAVGLGYGIGGCDVCEYRGFPGICWFCTSVGQLTYLALATSPLWLTAILHIRANWRSHQKQLYGDDYYDR